jgi:hypothetical protein
LGSPGEQATIRLGHSFPDRMDSPIRSSKYPPECPTASVGAHGLQRSSCQTWNRIARHQSALEMARSGLLATTEGAEYTIRRSRLAMEKKTLATRRGVAKA